MFTYIKLKNFMSFKDTTFDLRNGSKGAKNFISIYGENGSGKSNFISSINLLRRSVYIYFRNEGFKPCGDRRGLLRRSLLQRRWEAYNP